jgi:hypothetical protein
MRWCDEATIMKNAEKMMEKRNIGDASRSICLRLLETRIGYRLHDFKAPVFFLSEKAGEEKEYKRLQSPMQHIQESQNTLTAGSMLDSFRITGNPPRRQ